MPPTKEAKKPILSSEFRNRIQVNLVNMRVMRKRDIYENMQRWIMTGKDHCWHRDFYLGTAVTTTIVVNVGAVTKN